ncbi:Ppx/GppA phosphatase family protein [Aquibium oceanicum]|uniref:Ppx/GppA phosphatase family protein n=1 Tax=Aquibium oceanicum TaxID=1670800 RepID=UPI003605B044
MHKEARRRKDGLLKNLEDGGTPPDAEASQGVRAKKRRRHRKAANRQAAPVNGTGAAVPGKQDGASQDQRSKKRRKRRRGRKVYARDGAPAPNGGAARAEAVAPTAHAAPAAPDLVRASKTVEKMPGGAGMAPWRRPGGNAPAYAALDLGTNNCRLLVAVPTRPGQFRVVDAFSRIVRLGEGLTGSGRLGELAMHRAVEALKNCAEKLASRDIRKARLIATEACRSAENGAEFLARVTENTGLVLEVIDRETEARLAVSGCGSLVEGDTEGVVLFDIGGGSSEIALIDISARRTGRLADHIVSWTSLPVGVVSLSERFGGRHVTPEIFAAMVEDVAGMLDAFEGREKLGEIARSERFHLLGTSGTVTTLAGIFLELPRYDRRRVDGLWMDAGDVDRMVSNLVGWEFDQRVANPCIGPDRADLVLAGCAILEAIRKVWPSQRLRVADRGLREGILAELMAEDGAWRRGRENRQQRA